MSRLLWWLILIIILCMGFYACWPKPKPKTVTITEWQQMLNRKGYPVKVDGKLTVNGDGETEGAWNRLCADERGE
jgi:hypothetical protein